MLYIMFILTLCFLTLRPQIDCAWDECPICPTRVTAVYHSVLYQPLATVHVWSLCSIS